LFSALFRQGRQGEGEQRLRYKDAETALGSRRILAPYTDRDQS
jgi:hypothetical protein